MPEADAQIQSGGAGMFAYAPGGPGSATAAVDGGPQAGSTADQQQIYMQHMQMHSSHAFGGDAAAGGINLLADQMGLNAFVPAQQQGVDPNIPGAPAMFPSSLLDLQGASLDAEAEAERDRLLQQQGFGTRKFCKSLVQEVMGNAPPPISPGRGFLKIALTIDLRCAGIRHCYGARSD